MQPPPTDDTPSPAGARAQPATRVLLVDDSDDGRFIKGRILRAAGFEVVEAVNGTEALERATAGVSVVLLDIHLPDISGLDVARRLRAAPATAALPIVHTSATRRGVADAVIGLEGGADAYMVEPLDADLLVATVRSFARARAAELANARAAADWEATFDAIVDGIFVVARGTIERVNASGARILGAPREGLRGGRFDELLAGAIAGGPAREDAPLPPDGSLIVIRDHTYTVTSRRMREGEDDSASVVWVLHDVTSLYEERRKVATITERLVHSEEFLRAVTQSVPTGIYAIDVDGRFTFVNAAAEQALGWTAAELEGRSAHETIHHTKVDGSPHLEAECALRNVVRTGVSVTADNDFFIRSDGTGFRIAYSSAPLRVDGRLVGAAVAFQDMSERHRLEEALRARADELEEEGRAKDEFFAIVSHELRSPMTSILGWTQMLQAWLESSGHTDPDAREALEAIRASASLQDRIIADMLDLSRSVMGKLHLHFDTVDAAETVHAATAALRPAAEARGVHLRLVQNAPPGCTIHGDEARLRQIVSNLVGNAIKFTPAGGAVTVTLRAGDGDVVISVRDTGVGIAPEFLPRVFERFAQAGSARGAGGLGLGLAIVRALVEEHRGSISASSAGLGEGTEFTIRLPRTPAESHGPSG
jgi:PAS domain S-box-containing protein